MTGKIASMLKTHASIAIHLAVDRNDFIQSPLDSSFIVWLVFRVKMSDARQSRKQAGVSSQEFEDRAAARIEGRIVFLSKSKSRW